MLKVLSLFDGISCARVAIERAGLSIDKYYASEIDKYAIKIAQKNYPDTIQLGDINGWREWELPRLDLLVGGSPCQGFSRAGKQLNFEDERSKLFFTYVDILKHFKPTYFLLENVKMKQEWQDIISDLLGVKPILINSSLVSAQRRERLYWCNWKVSQPKDKDTLLKDILHENTWTDRDKSLCLDANYAKGANLETYNKSVRQLVVSGSLKIAKDGRVKRDQDKAGCLTGGGHSGGNHSDMDLLLFVRDFIVEPKQKITWLGKNVESGLLRRIGEVGQASRIYCIDKKSVTSFILGGEAQTGLYYVPVKDGEGVVVDGYIRRLTPVECERLQTLPDGYTEGVSNTQRYKALGNGFTVDVIEHLIRQNMYRVRETKLPIKGRQTNETSHN